MNEDVQAAIDAALLEEFSSLDDIFDSSDWSHASDLFMHHFVLYHHRASHHANHDRRSVATRRAWRGWLELADRTYLRDLAKDLGELSDRKASELAFRACSSLIDDLSEVARRSAGELSDAGRDALSQLKTLASEEVQGPNAKRLVARANASTTQLVELALSGAYEAFAEEEARPPSALSATVFAELMKVWRWSGQDPLVERTILTSGKKIGWKLYKASQFDHLLTLSSKVAPAVASFADRIEADLSHIAYASACAQMLVFHAESINTLEKQLPLAERALRICPEHRNGRIVLAELLSVKASRLLDAPGIGAAKQKNIQAAEDHLKRAKELWPTCKKLKKAEEKLKTRRGARGEFY